MTLEDWDAGKEWAENLGHVWLVIEGQDDEGHRGVLMAKKKWIQGAIKRPGALRKALGVKKGKSIPAGKLAAAAKKGGRIGKQARLAQTLKKLGKRKK